MGPGSIQASPPKLVEACAHACHGDLWPCHVGVVSPGRQHLDQYRCRLLVEQGALLVVGDRTRAESASSVLGRDSYSAHAVGHGSQECISHI